MRSARLWGSRDLTPHQLTRPSEQKPQPIFKYCTPSEWRKLCRGPPVNVPAVPVTFPFLSLPAELRNEVYRELLLTTIPLQLVHDRLSWPDTSIPGKQLYPAILCTSKTVCNEAVAILYGENTFYLHIDNTLLRWQADMHRLDSSFTLPLPITTYMSQIKRIVMHAGTQDRTRTRYELYRQLLNIGIKMDSLQLFAMQFPEGYLLEKNRRVNVEWLEEEHVSELKRKYVWFPPGSMEDEGWLVMREKRRDGGLIPGLGLST